MPRLGRVFLPDQPPHIIQRGNDRQRIFFAADDDAHYRDWLAEAARECGLAVHAYVLMTNHVHLLATPARAESAPRTLQSLGCRYVRHVNAARRCPPDEAALNQTRLRDERNLTLTPIIYGEGTRVATLEQVRGVAKRIYSSHPEILRALGL